MTRNELVAWWVGSVFGTIIVVGMLVAFVWSIQARSVGTDRRLHAEHMAEIRVCGASSNQAECFRRLMLP